MNYEQLTEAIMRLPLKQRLELIEAISRSLREELQIPEQKELAVSRLRGIAKPDGPPPTDEEVKEEYTRYLAEKYS